MNERLKFSQEEHLEMVKKAWDAYQPSYMGFNLKARPNYYQFYTDGGVSLDNYEIELLGDVRGLKLLDISCACDASQAFSWSNLGAYVTACDISSVAIEIARGNAQKMGLPVKFVVADAQTLAPIPDSEVDIVYATYVCWLEDIFKACRTWYRVLKPGGRLLLQNSHPILDYLEEWDGSLAVTRCYSDRTPEYNDSFDGTPLARQYGGWSVDLPIVEFYHTIADMVNAMAEAGFRIERMLETENSTKPLMSKLPSDIAIVGRKFDKAEDIIK